MDLIAYNRSDKQIEGVMFKSLDEVLSESDFLSINIAATKDTIGLLNKDKISLMKNSSIIVNTARADIINTEDLYNALIHNKIWGAGLDVSDIKDKEHPIFKLDNIIIMPHAAWFTQESLDNIGEIMVANVESFNKKQIINNIN